MAQQDDGWPLGLQPLNMRIGLVRNGYFSGSISFNSLLTGSSSSSTSTDSSSDLDTEVSTGSFFHENSITLGNLIGVSSILELPERSLRGRREELLRDKKNYRTKTWFFSLCSNPCSEVEIVNNHPPSLGHLLEAERRAAIDYRRERF